MVELSTWVLIKALVRMVIDLVLDYLNKGNIDIRVDVIDMVIALVVMSKILDRAV